MSPVPRYLLAAALLTGRVSGGNVSETVRPKSGYHRLQPRHCSRTAHPIKSGMSEVVSDQVGGLTNQGNRDVQRAPGLGLEKRLPHTAD